MNTSLEEKEVMQGFNDWQTGIKLNEQQTQFLTDYLEADLESGMLSKTSTAIINQILAKLEKYGS